jgi:rare lipoprotein A (peptidoglycan hydrolase)
VTIKNTNNGKTVAAQIQDVCPTCNNANSLDLSVGAFNAIASEADGMVPIEWSFN